MQHRSRAFLVLGVAVLAMAWAAPLIRLTAAAPLAVAAWRLVLSTLLLAPLAVLRPWHSEWRNLGAGDRRAALLAGLALALHFAAWITSLRLTSVAASSVLVSLSPVFSWLLSALLLHERPAPRQAAGIVAAVIGATIIGLGDLAHGSSTSAPQPLLGDALALAGALFGGIYFVVGRRLRARLSLAAYVTPVYGIAAAVLLLWAAARGVAFGPFTTGDWAIFLALASGPMLIGHTGFNYALRFLPAYAVNVAALGEPAGATLIAWLLPALAEPPSLWAVSGGAVAVGGIALALAAPRGRTA